MDLNRSCHGAWRNPVIAVGQHVVQWVAERTNSKYFDAVGIGWERDAQLIAGVVYDQYNGVNMQMHVASDGTRRWLCREYLHACFDYPFNQAKVKRVTGLVGEGNLAARRFDEHLGFVLETTLKGAHPSGDLLVYVLWKEACKWIKHENLYKNRQRLAA